MKEYEKALADFNKAISLDPNYATAYLNRGILKESQRNREGCCSDWQTATELGVETAKKFLDVECAQ